jgi:SulP family sulfate permease
MKVTLGLAEQVWSGVFYGVINGILCIPISISFTSIIFRNELFAHLLPNLVKLLLFSCMIHQLSFTLFSGLPFAVGQVQDAGLIFLSAMASSIVASCGLSTAVPTALFVMSTYTALLGVGLILVGRLKLASVVQYLPMPVIGGYLAFIGFFCGQAGLAMMAGVDVSGISDWDKLFTIQAVKFFSPGLIIGFAIYFLLGFFRSPFVLPACLAVSLVLFYGILWMTGMSMQDARDAGWVAQMQPQGD